MKGLLNLELSSVSMQMIYNTPAQPVVCMSMVEEFNDVVGFKTVQTMHVLLVFD